MNWKLKVFSYFVAISYLLVILYTWIVANSRGEIYFSAGEPVEIIKYFEWGAAIVSIFVLLLSAQSELNQGGDHNSL